MPTTSTITATQAAAMPPIIFGGNLDNDFENDFGGDFVTAFVGLCCWVCIYTPALEVGDVNGVCVIGVWADAGGVLGVGGWLGTLALGWTFCEVDAGHGTTTGAWSVI